MAPAVNEHESRAPLSSLHPWAQAGGRKRHMLADTNGVPVAAVVHEADIQDCDGAPLGSMSAVGTGLRGVTTYLA